MVGSASDRGDGLRESDSCEAVEQLVVALGWSAEGSGLSGDGVYDFVVCGVDQVLNEVVGALSFDARRGGGRRRRATTWRSSLSGSSTALTVLYNTEGATLLEYANEERVATPAAGH